METNTFGNELLKMETNHEKIVYLFKVFGIKEEFFDKFKYKMLTTLHLIEDLEINKNFSIKNIQMLYQGLAEYHIQHFENGLNLSTYPENSFLYSEIKKIIEAKHEKELELIKERYLFLLFPTSTVVLDYLIQTNFFPINFNKEKITSFMENYNFFQKLTLQKWIRLKTNEPIYSQKESLRLILEYGDISLFSPSDKNLFIQKLKETPDLFNHYTKENILTKYLTYQELFEILEKNKGLLFNENFMNSSYGEIIKNDVSYIEKYNLEDNLQLILKIWPEIQNDINFALKMGKKDIDSLHYFENFKENPEIQKIIIEAFFEGELFSTYQDY